MERRARQSRHNWQLNYASAMTIPRVIADVDTGIDDALALAWLGSLHAKGKIELTVTTSAGNTTVMNAARNSNAVLRMTGSSARAIPGLPRPRVLPLTTTPETHGPEGLGYWQDHEPEDASDPGQSFLEAWRKAQPTHVLIAGPATNLAYVMDHAPRLLENTQVTLMTGAFIYPGNTTPTAEWNAWVDPHALKHVLGNWPASAPLLTICPLNTTERVLLTPERLQGILRHLSLAQAELADLLIDATRFYFEFHEQVGVGYQAQIHDLAAAQVLLRDELWILRGDVDKRKATVDVEADSELLRGTTVADWDGSYWDRVPNAEVLTRIEPESVFATFESALG